MFWLVVVLSLLLLSETVLSQTRTITGYPTIKVTESGVFLEYWQDGTLHRHQMENGDTIGTADDYYLLLNDKTGIFGRVHLPNYENEGKSKVIDVPGRSPVDVPMDLKGDLLYARNDAMKLSWVNMRLADKLQQLPDHQGIHYNGNDIYWNMHKSNDIKFEKPHHLQNPQAGAYRQYQNLMNYDLDYSYLGQHDIAYLRGYVYGYNAKNEAHRKSKLLSRKHAL